MTDVTIVRDCRRGLVGLFLWLAAMTVGCSEPPLPPPPAPTPAKAMFEDLSKEIEALEGEVREALLSMMKEIQEGDINAEDAADRVSKTVEKLKTMRERIRKELPEEPQRKPVA